MIILLTLFTLQAVVFRYSKAGTLQAVGRGLALWHSAAANYSKVSRCLHSSHVVSIVLNCIHYLHSFHYHPHSMHSIPTFPMFPTLPLFSPSPLSYNIPSTKIHSLQCFQCLLHYLQFFLRFSLHHHVYIVLIVLQYKTTFHNFFYVSDVLHNLPPVNSIYSNVIHRSPSKLYVNIFYITL